MSRTEFDVYIEPEERFEIEAFRWPPVLDRLRKELKELNEKLQQVPGLEDLTLEITPVDGLLAYRFNNGEWVPIIAVSSLRGEDGREVSISIDEFILKWRLGAGEWVNLIDLSTLGYFKKDSFSAEHFKESLQGKIELKEVPANIVKGKRIVDEEEIIYDIQTVINNLLESIPTDLSDLTDEDNLIPPHLHFDPTTFTGTGTTLDPIDIPKKRFVELKIEDEIQFIEFTKWSDGSDIYFTEGSQFNIFIHHPEWKGGVGGRINVIFYSGSNDFKGHYNSRGLVNSINNYFAGSVAAGTGDRQTNYRCMIRNKNLYGWVVGRTTTAEVQMNNIQNNVVEYIDRFNIGATDANGFQPGTYIRIDEL